MDFANDCDPHTPGDPSADLFPTALKILVAGGFGVGKTTLSAR